MKDFYKQILQDVAVELTDEFDRNFERKAFFTKKWSKTKFFNRRGSILMRSGNLRSSIQNRLGNNSISWTSSRPYASLQNEGGEITVTRKMQKYFWAMYMKTLGSQSRVYGEGDSKFTIISSDSKDRVKKTLKSKSKIAQKKQAEAELFKAMAMKKVGSKITIPERKFIGDHPEVRKAIERCADVTFNEIEKFLTDKLKQR